MDVKGSFIFRNEGNGCLTSIYLEHKTDTPYTECCKRSGRANPNNPFEGNFNTCWLESGRAGSRQSNLSIKQEGDTYTLEWTNISGSKTTYKGTAMLFEDKLIGCYWEE